MKNLQEYLALIDELNADEQTRQILIEAAKTAVREQDASTKSRPKRAGFTQLKTALPKSQNPKFKPRPKLTLQQKVTRENEPCRNCKGNCGKVHDRWCTAFVGKDTSGDPDILYKRCRYGLLRDARLTFGSARIPARYVGVTFDDYEVDSFNRDAVAFAKNIFKLTCGAYFYGECGSGKTFLAALIAQEFVSRGKSVIFVKVPALLDEIRATFNGQGRESDVLDELERAELVVLDDFGMEKPTQWAGATLCKILDMRYDSGGRTIITSNLSPDELEERLNTATDGANFNGSRILDRCLEMCKPVLLGGVSRRY